MKLNLPSTLTEKKVQLLYVLTLSRVLSVNAGSQFSSCVGNDYNTLVSFANNVPDKEVFCCGNNAQCTALSSTGCPLGINTADFQGQCNKVGHSTFCVAWGYYNFLMNKTPGNNLCGGVTENSALTNAMVGTCPSFDVIGNTLSSQSTVPNSFSWLCCDSNSCSVPLNVAINRDASNHYVASTNCQANQYALMCFNDNGGWTCTGSVGSNIPDVTQPIGNCVVQTTPSSIPGGTTLSSTESSPKNSPTAEIYCPNSTDSCNGNDNGSNNGNNNGNNNGHLSGCFPNEAMLTLENGETKLIKDIKLGDSVKYRNNKYSKIFAIGHKQYEDFNNYLKIKTTYHEDNNFPPLLLSLNHYLYVNGDNLQLAKNVKLGDYLVNEKDELTLIISIESVYLQGINNPLTIDGSIIVNGIKASCYTEELHPFIADKLVFPLKAIYKISGGKLMGAEDFVINSIIDIWDYYEKLTLSNQREEKEMKLETKIEIPPK